MANAENAQNPPNERPIEAHDLLELGDRQPIATGTYRDVYIFPNRPDAVVKVLRPGVGHQPNRPIRNFLKARSIRQLYRFMFREYEAFLEAKLRQVTSPGPLPVSELFWLQRTSRGLGMVAERARGQSGGPAVSLGDLKRDGGFDATMLDALNGFIARMEVLDVVVNDTNPENVLLDESHDTPRFLLVDGFGDPNPIQVKRLSPTLRKRSRARRWNRMAEFLELEWNPTKEMLERP